MVSKTGAELVRFALEQLPISHTFGVPGVHNTELYDTLGHSEKIKPVLVTHEISASFMADGVSRTSNQIGCLLIVPAAGVTHALSGIAEAYLAGIPMLVISGGVRTDIERSFKLHEWDQHKVLEPTTKKTFHIQSHEEIVDTLYRAYEIATSGFPGPVFVEVPVNIQLFKKKVHEPKPFAPRVKRENFHDLALDEICSLIKKAKNPGIFVGWGAREAGDDLCALAEKIQAPVATTLQGLSVFPYDHELHVGMGFGNYSVPASTNYFKNCDLLIAIGTSFSEISTGSYSVNVPENLVHIDINPDVFNKNYAAKVCLESDAKEACKALVRKLEERNISRNRDTKLVSKIKEDKLAYKEEWKTHTFSKVNPYLFISSLRNHLSKDAIAVTDDGNHTFLMAELFENYSSKNFICPTDFNCMGYSIPAAIGAKLANPSREVVCVVGDGAYLMSFVEILTAYKLGLGVVFCVFHDGELSQISQGQELPYNKKTCTDLEGLDIEGTTRATKARYLQIAKDTEIDQALTEALHIANNEKKPVVVDVLVDYSKQTRFTKSVMKSTFQSFPLREKFRFGARSLWRKVVQ